MIDYTLMPGGNYAIGVRKLQSKIEEAGQVWDSLHTPIRFWPFFSWPKRLNVWTKKRELYVQIAMEVDWRKDFSVDLNKAGGTLYWNLICSNLFGQKLPDKYLSKLSKLLDAVPYQGTGIDREKLILLLILEDDGKSWDVPVDVLLQLLDIPSGDVTLAFRSLKESAEKFDKSLTKTKA